MSIMVSYKTANRSVADEIFARLEKAGLSPWLDYKGIEEGEQWRDELIRQVRTCSAFVALLTPEYVESEHCRMEVFIARSRGCPILPMMLEDCFQLFDRYEETKGLADTFMVRLYPPFRVVGLSLTRDEAMERVVAAARSIGQEPPPKKVYVSYCNNEAAVATQIAQQLEQDGISAWVATRDCRVGDNWREAQARGVMNAAVQVVVLDETIANANVLRTEIMLAEAFGLPLFTVLGTRLEHDDATVARVMKDLRGKDITYERLAKVQPFRCDEESVRKLAKRLRSVLPAQ